MHGLNNNKEILRDYTMPANLLVSTLGHTDGLYTLMLLATVLGCSIFNMTQRHRSACDN